MKTINIFFIVIATVVAIQANAQQDAITRLFGKYVDDTRFTAVYISPKVFDMISTLTKEQQVKDKELTEVLTNLKGIRILSTETTPKAFFQEALKSLETNKFDLLMQVRDKTENVRFFVRDDGPVVDELILLVGGDNSFTVMSFTGKIDLKKISKLSESINVDGAEHLEKLEK
ncbi:MAG TPA: DUF4252 domain-containing protein [Saprospirales bacterium]|nr:DUF4252 domain-containing protein [Saprospirales bacterium]HRQ30344.1 DUF4252 domain-containing protein [Saprospiraceae bacterium]